MHTNDTFHDGLPAHWHVTQQGAGQVRAEGDGLALRIPPISGPLQYHNAQITDYDPRARRFTLRPPLRVIVEAQFDTPPHAAHGTAGFGLWNHTFDPTQRGFRLPQTAWFFFASAETNLALAQGVLGWGWKAATLDAGRWRARALLPLAPLAIPLMRVPPLYRHLYPAAQAVLGVQERALDLPLLAERCRYEILWESDALTFTVDGVEVLRTSHAPRGPLGFIAWIDTQYAVVTPQGQFAFGVCRADAGQGMRLHHVEVSEP
ncbi:MAG: hypothetical protein SNJ54_15865 [Anaerolineae bacterium]